MRRLLPLVLICVLAAGCRPDRPSGREILSAMSEAKAASASRVRDGLVYVEVQFQNGRRGEATGMLLNQEGFFLFPARVERDKIQRARAWYRGQEWPAEFVKDDERLNVTVFRIAAAAKPFAPSPASSVPPAAGDWLVAVSASGKDADFQSFSRLVTVMGTLSQEFDRILLSEAGHPPGTVLADLDGNRVGLLQGNEAVLLSDVQRRLESVLSKPRDPVAASSPGEDGKGNPWIGVTLEPINEEYAEWAGLPKEAVWIQQAFEDAPARKAGLLPGDLIVKVGGKPLGVGGQRALPRLMKLFAPQIGREMAIEVLREGKPLSFSCRFEKKPDPKELKAEDLGIQVQEITEALVHETANLYCRKGMFVTDVVRGGPAAAGRGTFVVKGDAVIELDGHPTPTLEAFSSALDALRRSGKMEVLLKIQRGVRTTHSALNLALRQKGETH